jgi:hypothetical protein
MTEHSTLAEALVAALADLTVVEKARKANAGSYSYDYADIADVVKLTRPRLAEHGIVALTPVTEHNGGLGCTVTLLHTSGDRLDFGPFPFPFGKDAQATGSMVTYHRRYALVAALGMAAGDDDDGAKAVAGAPVQAQEDPAVPGLRSSIQAAVAKLSEGQQAALKAWWTAERLPNVRQLNAAQCDRVIEHLVDMDPDPAVEGEDPT